MPVDGSQPASGGGASGGDSVDRMEAILKKLEKKEEKAVEKLEPIKSDRKIIERAS